MKINRKFLAIKIHFFLRFAATATLALFLPLIVLQKGVSPKGIGLLWTVLPFIALFTNSASGAIADAFKIHRAVFILGLTLLTFGMCCLYLLPSMEANKASFQSVSSSLEEGSLRSQNNGVNKCSDSCVDEETVVNWKNGSQTEPELSLFDTLQSLPFWLVFLCLLVEHIGMGITIIFTDAVCFKILGSEFEKYGKQRMWGTIGMGMFSFIMGALIDWYSEGLPQQDFLPAFVICMILMCLDIALVSTMVIPSTSKENFNWAILKTILKCPLTILFLLMIVVYGFSCGINWTFRLMLVEEVALEFDPNFPAMKLLLGILMSVETFGGELPFLFLSGKIIKRFGHVPVFVMCLICISVRYFLYFMLANPWLFLFVEFLNGPSYGLFHANMVSYGTSIAPSGALATIQAIIRASVSAGQSAGGLIGGVLYDKKGGRHTFLSSSLIIFAFTLIYSTIQLLNKLYLIRQNQRGDYIKPSNVNASEVQIEVHFSHTQHEVCSLDDSKKTILT